jgi:RHS repeat-associated protein
MRRIYTVVGMLLFAFIATVEAQTQNYYNTQTGVPPGTMQYPVPGGVANLDTGNLFLKFPLASIPQRSGRPVTLSLVYNSNFWANVDFLPPATAAWYYPVNNGGLNLTIDWGAYPFAQHDTTQDPSQCPLGGIAEIYNDYRTVDSNGTEVNFGNLQTTQYKCLNGSGGYNPVFGTKSAAGWSVGNEGYYLSVDNYGQSYQLWAPDGTMTTFPSGTQNDSNGNVLGNTFDAQSNWIDQLGRKNDILYGSASTPCPTIDQNMGGTTPSDSCSVVVQTDDGPATYTWTYEQIPVCSANSNNIPTGSYCGNINVPYTLTLPGTGAQYKFSYDQGTTPGHYGALTGITLPTGATLTYSYLPNTLPVNGYITGLLVPHSASDGFGTTTFTFSSPGYNNLSVNITTPRNDLATYTTTLSTTAPYTYTKVLSQYSGTANLLKTTTTVTDAALHPQTVTTTWNKSGKSATTTYQYAPNTWLVALKQEGDFTGAIVRTTKIDYLTDTGSVPYVSQYHILNRPQQVQVFPGSATSGTPLSQTIYTYDEYSAGYCKNGLPGLTDHTSAVGHLTSYGTSYTGRGNATTASRLISGSTYATTHTCYDTLGGVTQTIDANGNPTTLDNTDSWASGGSSTCETGADTYAFPTTITNALGQQQKLSYSTCSGQLTVSQDPNDIANGRNGTKYEYADPRERLTSVSYPDLGGSSTLYNDAAVSRTDTILMSTSPAQNKVVTTNYDGLGRVKETQLTTDPVSVVKQDTTYDASGNVHTVTNPYRSTSDPTYGLTTYLYDALQRPTKKTNPDGSWQYWCYDGYMSDGQSGCTSNLSSQNGSWVDYEDETGRHWQRISDGLGRLTAVMEPEASTTPSLETDYTYNGLDDLLQVDQWGGAKGSTGDRVRAFLYDSLSRLTNACNLESIAHLQTCSVPGTWSNVYTYDANGNLQTRIDARIGADGVHSITTTNTYDALNRITVKTYSNDPVGTPSMHYFYDTVDNGWGWATQPQNLIGRLAGVNVDAAPYAWIKYGYDPMGRINIKSECVPRDCGNNHYDMYYQYDLAGNMTFYDRGRDLGRNNTYPNQGYYFGGFTMAYDGSGNIKSVTADTTNANQPAGILSGPVYTPLGGLSAGNVMGLYQQTRTYDKRGRYTGLTVTSGSSQVWNTTTGYFANGAVMSSTDNSNGSWSYLYGNTNRLAQVVGTPFTLAYTYDHWGNRNSQLITAGSGTAPQWSHGYDINNRVAAGVSYDAAGNVLSDGVHTYKYDAEGRIYSVDGTTTYVYDGENNRVALLKSGTIQTEFLYDFNGHLMTEVGLNYKAARSNVYVGSRLLAEDAPDPSRTSTPLATLLRITDQVGTLRSLWDVGLNRLETCISLPYGDPYNGHTTNCTASDSDHFFTGKQRDTESNLDYFGARYYSSTLGIFMTPEYSMNSAIMELPQTWNKYNYEYDRPLDGSDPDGRCPPCVGAIIGGVAEGLVDLGKQLVNNGGQLTGSNGVKWGEVGANVVGGAVAGGLAVATGGASLVESAIVGDIAAGGTANIVGGVVTRTLDPNTQSNDVLSAGEISQDALAGFVGGVGGHLAGDAIHIPDEPVHNGQASSGAIRRDNAKFARYNGAVTNQITRATIAGSAVTHATGWSISLSSTMLTVPAQPDPTVTTTECVTLPDADGTQQCW